MRDNLKQAGEEIQGIRRRLNMSREELAAAVALKPDTVRKIEEGYQPASEAVMVSIRNLEKLRKPFLELKEPSPEYPKVPFPAEPRRKVPVVSWARAGAISERGLNYGDLAQFIDETVETDCKNPYAFGLIIEGDSMSPEYLPGDRVVFSPLEEPRNGDRVVARVLETGETYFKVFKRTGKEGQSVKLESINKAYKTLTFKWTDFRFIYPAVDMVRKIRR